MWKSAPKVPFPNKMCLEIGKLKVENGQVPIFGKIFKEIAFFDYYCFFELGELRIDKSCYAWLLKHSAPRQF